MLSNSCHGLPAVGKQQQEEISRNHVPSLFAVSVIRGMESALRSKGMKLKWLSPSLLGSHPFNHASNVLNESCPSIHPSNSSMWSRVSSLARSQVASNPVTLLRSTPKRTPARPSSPFVRWYPYSAHFLGSFGKLLGLRG